MLYYSTNSKSADTKLSIAVTKGLAPDNGLYMPEKISRLPKTFFNEMLEMELQEISLIVAKAFFGNDIEEKKLQEIIYETMNFEIPLVEVTPDIFSLELYHGPTLAFKDVGARFMARMLSYFIQKEKKETVNVLVATSGDTGSAVANGFLGVDGIHVHVLYPQGLVGEIQEKQFTTLGRNITALEMYGNLDDCQRFVKNAFLDQELNEVLTLTSANSINVARFLPQSFYYFWGYAQMKMVFDKAPIICAVPSGNFGNITAGIIAKKMGLPISRFIAANNKNDIFLQYLKSGKYNPKASIATLANAMDVGDPSNFVRVLDLYKQNHSDIIKEVSGISFTDDDIRQIIKTVYKEYDYLLDPHGATGFQALNKLKSTSEKGFFIETAHPAKFLQTVENIIDEKIEIHQKLKDFMQGTKHSVCLSSDFSDFKKYLLTL